MVEREGDDLVFEGNCDVGRELLLGGIEGRFILVDDSQEGRVRVEGCRKVTDRKAPRLGLGEGDHKGREDRVEAGLVDSNQYLVLAIDFDLRC